MDDTPRRVRINRDVELSTGDGPADPWLVPAPAAAPPPPAPAPAPPDEFSNPDPGPSQRTQG